MPKTLQQIHEDVPADYYDRGIKLNILQRIWHKKRFNEVRAFSSDLKGRALDIGCHSGLFTKQILQSSNIQQIYGVDISAQAIALAKNRIKKGRFFVADAHKLPFKDNFFDSIVCLEMLEHVENPQKVISEINRVLKKSGQGIILIPTDNQLFRIIWFLWNLYRPVWKHAHINSFNYSTVASLLKREKLIVKESKRFSFNMLLIIKFHKKY